MYNNLNLNISPLNKTVIYCVVLFGERFTKTDKMGIYPVLNFFLKHCFFLSTNGTLSISIVYLYV